MGERSEILSPVLLQLQQHPSLSRVDTAQGLQAWALQHEVVTGSAAVSLLHTPQPVISSSEMGLFCCYYNKGGITQQTKW